MKPLFAIGYEGRTVEQLLARLKAKRVGLMVDVRALALCYKRGVLVAAAAERPGGGR